MRVWVLGVCVVAIVLGTLVLAFCAYELRWKSRRVRSEVQRMAILSQAASAMWGEAVAARGRVADAAARLAER